MTILFKHPRPLKNWPRAWIATLLLLTISAQAKLEDIIQERVTSTPMASPGRSHAQLTNIFGNNDKVLLQDALHLASPLSKIGKLIVPEGQCTATLVGRNLILTSAHCIATNDGSGIQSGVFRFQLNDHYGQLTAETIVEEYWYGSFHRLERDRDWAILRIRDYLGDTYGYLGWINMDNIDPRSQNLIQAGYGRLWQRGRELSIHEGCALTEAHREARIFSHTCDTSLGDSGSPLIYCNNPSDCRIVAIHAAEVRGDSDDTLILEHYDPNHPNLAVAAIQFISPLWNLLEKYGR